MIIRLAENKDFEAIIANDKWISREMFAKKISEKQVYVVCCGDIFAGWLRYGLFWDNTPFMNMLHLTEEYSGKEIGSQMVGKMK